MLGSVSTAASSMFPFVSLVKSSVESSSGVVTCLRHLTRYCISGAGRGAELCVVSCWLTGWPAAARIGTLILLRHYHTYFLTIRSNGPNHSRHCPPARTGGQTRLTVNSILHYITNHPTCKTEVCWNRILLGLIWKRILDLMNCISYQIMIIFYILLKNPSTIL